MSFNGPSSEPLTFLTLFAMGSGRAQDAEELQATQQALAEAQAAVIVAQEATAAAEAARADVQKQLDEAVAVAAQAGTAARGPLGEQLNIPQIPRPLGSGWSIQESMQVTRQEYAEIQVRPWQCLSVTGCLFILFALAHNPKPSHPRHARLDG